jgi:hypothetical protein
MLNKVKQVVVWGSTSVGMGKKLHHALKWIDIVPSLKKQTKSGKKRTRQQFDIDVEEDETSLGERSFPRNLKREVSTIGLQESMKEIISVKESSSGKRGEMRARVSTWIMHGSSSTMR